MTEDEINKLADLIFDRICEKQEQMDEDYHNQVRKLYENGFIIDNVTGNIKYLTEEEKLVGELAKLQTIMMILEDKEDYENAAVIKKKVDSINKKLNAGSGKW
jgi:hypothetical protein